MSDSKTDIKESAEEEKETEVEDEDLFASLSTFVEKVTIILEDYSDIISGENQRYSSPPGQESEDDSGQLSMRGIDQIVTRLSDGWEKYPKYSQCKSSFHTCDLYDKEIGYAIEMGVLEGKEEWEKLLKEDTLYKFFKRYLSKSDSTKFDETVFRETYLEFEDYLTSDSIVYRARTVLLNFQMDRDEMQLGENLHIERMDPEDSLSQMARAPIHPRYRNQREFFVLEKTYETDKFDENQTEQADRTFDEIVLAFRLFKSIGDIGYYAVIAEATSLFHENGVRSIGQPLVDFFGKKYHLSEEESDEFVSFWHSMERLLNDPPESFRIALDKFSNSFQRENENDRLLDLVITLEAIYLKEGEAQEMSYRLSQRGALFLGENKERALNIKQILRDSYNTRSTLVHGGSTNVTQDEIIELHELTRESLSKFLSETESGKNHKSILAGLDEEAVTPIE